MRAGAWRRILAALAALPWLAAVLATGSATVSAAAARQGAELSLEYTLWMGGLPAAVFDAGFSRAEGRYRIAFEARTEGLTGWLYPFSLSARASGRIEAADSLRPLSFLSDSRGRTRRHRLVIFDEDGIRAFQSEDGAAPRPPKDFDPAALEGSLDPATALLAAVTQLASAGRCDSRLPVYDGRRGYRLTLEHVGPDELAPSRYSAVSGPAIRCRIALERRLEVSRESRYGGLMPSSGEIWFGAVPGYDAPVPWRLETSSLLGALVVHLSRVGPAPDSECRVAADPDHEGASC